MKFSTNDVNISLSEIFVNNKYRKKIIYLAERLWHTPLMKTHGTGIQSAKEFEKWMMDNGLSYSSIASACGVSERTVRQWISQKGIPERFTHCLKNLLDSSRQTVSFVGGTGKAASSSNYLWTTMRNYPAKPWNPAVPLRNWLPGISILSSNSY